MTNLPRNYYAGIGSRETPEFECKIMTRFATYAEKSGFVLRSGGAQGADLAFEAGVANASNKEIYLPWKGFNGLSGQGYIIGYPTTELEERANNLAASIHPNWGACSQGARRMHTRNMAQIMGSNLSDPVKFVVCYTHKGSGKGGTGQALRLAHLMGIPVFDLGHEDIMAVCNQLKDHIDSLVR
jgi:hypothetical protein